MQTGDLKFIKSLNGQQVLNLIRKQEVISSSELVQKTKLRPSTIFNILKNLSERNLITNLGKGDSTEKGGKKPFMWELNKDAAYTIGLDIEINQLRIVVVDLVGNVLFDKVVKFASLKNVEDLYKVIQTNVESTIIEQNLKNKILGLGIALPAIVKANTGHIIRTDIVSNKDIPLAQKLSEIFEFPIYIENNANATAIGAKWLGAAKGCRNFLVVLAEFDKGIGGFGLGIVIDENIYYGHSYCAGELNIPLMNLEQMMIYIRNDLDKSEYLREYDSRPDDITLDVLISAAQFGDELAIKLFKKLGNQIGEIVNHSISLLNPEALIIAGTISDLKEIIIEPIKEIISLKSLPFIHEPLKISTSLQGPRAVALGAASLILNDFFKIPVIKRKGLNNQISVLPH
ncbi:MAG: ROK family protein [Melioribacteraceae bacterium]|nr:ROK family protein [Melioribacteraceae bacterium]